MSSVINRRPTGTTAADSWPRHCMASRRSLWATGTPRFRPEDPYGTLWCPSDDATDSLVVETGFGLGPHVLGRYLTSATLKPSGAHL